MVAFVEEIRTELSNITYTFHWIFTMDNCAHFNFYNQIVSFDESMARCQLIEHLYEVVLPILQDLMNTPILEDKELHMPDGRFSFTYRDTNGNICTTRSFKVLASEASYSLDSY